MGSVGNGRLLAAPSALTRLPYVAAQLLGELGDTPTSLSARAVKRIHQSLPVPAEHEILWADVAFGTRTHGIVLTNQGIFLKDGPSEDEDSDDEPDNGLEYEGAGYHYFRWENFDPELISHTNKVPTVAGTPFIDRPRFLQLVNPCVRMHNRRVRMRRAGKAAVKGVLRPNRDVRSVYRPTVAQTFKACFDELGFYAFVANDDLPLYFEVPANHYDAVLQRMRKKIEGGWVVGFDDPDVAAVLVRKGTFTYPQAANLARTLRSPRLELDPAGTVSCDDPRGLSALAQELLNARNRRRQANGTEGVLDEAAQAMASGAATQANAQRPAAQTDMKNLLVGNATSTAGRAIGAAGARALTTALGVTFAPFAMVASLALGEVCEKRGLEAFTMAKDLFIEPQTRVMGRLFDGIYSNVVFEYALGPVEQEALVALMGQLGAPAFQQLGATLRESPHQEEDIRAFLVPLCELVRRR